MPGGNIYTYVSSVLKLPEEPGPASVPRCPCISNNSGTGQAHPSHVSHPQAEEIFYGSEGDIMLVAPSHPPRSKGDLRQMPSNPLCKSSGCPNTATPALYPVANSDSGQAQLILYSMAEVISV